MNGISALGLALLVASIVGIGIYEANYIVSVEYAYRTAIGAHIDNAYDASTFEVMRANLVLAIAGMEAQGLRPQDCGKAFHWEQTRDWCMAYQYEYLRGLVNRTDYYIRTFTANNTSPFTDIYTQAMTNMRTEFGRNGPADWVAYPAWALKYHGLYYWGVAFWVLFILMLLIGLVLFGLGWDM